MPDTRCQAEPLKPGNHVDAHDLHELVFELMVSTVPSWT